MPDKSAILAPLPDAEWDESLQPLAEKMQRVLNIHRIIAHNPALMSAYAPLRNYIVANTNLTPRQRELLILRVAYNLQSDYEWQQHVIRGRAAGLTDEEIAGVRDDGYTWDSPEISWILRCADEIHQIGRVSAETARALQSHLDNAALLDIIFTVGIYHIMGVLLSSFDVPIDAES